MAFLDHFDSSLDARWTSVISGSGSAAIANSELTITKPGASDVAYVYYNTPIATTDTGLWLFSAKSASGGFRVMTGGWSTASPGTAIAYDNYSGMDLRVEIADNSGQGFIQLGYQDSTGPTWQWWEISTNSWSSGRIWSNANRIEYDNYLVYGIELDGTNERFRFHAWNIAAPSTSYTYDQGLRLFFTTDWVNWADCENAGANINLIMGVPYNDVASSGAKDHEWVRLEDGTKKHAWTNVNIGGTNYDIRHSWSYGDISNLVPEDRTTLAVDVGAGATWDDGHVKDPMVVKDGATYYMFYSGQDGSVYQIGLATASDPDGPWAKDAGNPILALSGAAESQVAFPYVIKDESEPDANKRWKMVYIGLDSGDSKFSLYYAYASSPTATWTRYGMILDHGSGADADADAVHNPVLIWYGGQWELWYAMGKDNGSFNEYQIGRATSLTMEATFSKDAGNPKFGPVTTSKEVITADLNSRTATVSSTTGFTKDDYILITQDSNSSNYGISRVRKVNTDTSLELYHELNGFTSAASAQIRNQAAFRRFYPRHIEKIGGVWYMWGVTFGSYLDDSGNYQAFHELSGLWSHAGTGGPDSGTWALVQGLQNPVIHMDNQGGSRSNENLTFVTLPLTRIPIPRPFPTFRPAAS